MKTLSKNHGLGVLNPLALATGLALALTAVPAGAQSGAISGHVTVGQTGVGARNTYNRTENIVFSRGGTTYASDVTGNGYTANFAVGYTNMGWLVAPGTGPFPAAKGAFQTGSGYLVVPNATNTLNPLPITVMAWVNTTNTTGPILGKVVGNPNASGYLLMVYQGNASAVYWGSSGNYVDWSSGTTTISDGAWHQIAYTVDASGGKLYVDGTLQATKGWTGTARSCGVTLPLYFGATDAQRTGAAGWSYLPGSLLSEASLWSTALNASQIAGYLNQGPAGTETNLLAYWPLASALVGATTAADGSYTNSGLYSNVGQVSLSASYLGAPCVPASQLAAVGATNVNFVELTALVNPLGATNVQATSATLYGPVVPLFPGATNSAATFNYGPTTNYGFSVVATTNLPGGNLTLDGVANADGTFVFENVERVAGHRVEHQWHAVFQTGRERWGRRRVLELDFEQHRPAGQPVVPLGLCL